MLLRQWIKRDLLLSLTILLLPVRQNSVCVPPILKSSALSYYSSSGDEDLDPDIDINTSDSVSTSSTVLSALRRQYIRLRSTKRGRSRSPPLTYLLNESQSTEVDQTTRTLPSPTALLTATALTVPSVALPRLFCGPLPPSSVILPPTFSESHYMVRRGHLVGNLFSSPPTKYSDYS